MTTITAPPPVIVRVPEDFGPADVLVRHQPWGVEVDIRPQYTQASWRPIAFYGGTFEVRSS